MANDAKIRLTAEDATAAAFASVSDKFGKLGAEAAALPGKFAAIAVASAGLGSIAGFASMISSAIEAKARLGELSTQTNISVEALSSLGKVGKFSNTSLDDIASASNKLSKALFSQNEDSKGAAQAIAALGLNFDKFKALQPEQQMLAVAKALDTFQDGSEKSAVAMLLFGKQGAQLLPFLKELAERGITATKETAALAKAAKQYEDNLKTLAASGDEWKKTLVNDMLPALVEFTSTLVEGKKAYGDWYSYIVDTATRNPFKSTVEDLASTRDEIEALNKRIAEARDPNASIWTKITRLKDPDGAEHGEYMSDLQNRLRYLKAKQARDALANGSENYENGRLGRKPRLKQTGAADPDTDKDARALLHKQFEGQLKLIQDFADQQKDAYAFANQYLKNVYDDGVTSLSDFFEKQRALRDAGLQAQIESFDKTIAEAEKYMAKNKKILKPEELQAAQNKIDDAKEKRTRAVQKASQDSILSVQEEAKAVKELAYSYYDFLAVVKESRGDNVGSAAIRVAKDAQANQERLTKLGFDPAEAKRQSEELADRQLNQVRLNQAQTDYGRLVEVASIAEKNATLDAQASGQSEMDTLRQIAAIRLGALGDLSKEVDKARELAEALGTPEARLFSAKLALQFKQAAAEIDPLLMKTRELGQQMGGSIASSLEDAIVEGKKLSDVVKELEKNILHMLFNSQITKPFENWLTGVIGGNGQASGGGGILGKLFPSLFGPVSANAAGGAASAGFGTGAGFGNMDFGGFFADGGTLQPGQWGIAGENGPERIYAGAQPMHVMPNGGGMTVHNHFTISGPIDRRSQDQIALAAMQGAQRAARRNG